MYIRKYACIYMYHMYTGEMEAPLAGARFLIYMYMQVCVYVCMHV